MHVPVTTNITGCRLVSVDSPLLGMQEVVISDSSLHAGQLVYLEYHVGRLSGAPQITGLNLQPRPVFAPE